MSVQQLLYGCITSSVPAKKVCVVRHRGVALDYSLTHRTLSNQFVELVQRYEEREKATSSELDLRTQIASKSSLTATIAGLSLILL